MAAVRQHLHIVVHQQQIVRLDSLKAAVIDGRVVEWGQRHPLDHDLLMLLHLGQKPQGFFIPRTVVENGDVVIRIRGEPQNRPDTTVQHPRVIFRGYANLDPRLRLHRPLYKRHAVRKHIHHRGPAAALDMIPYGIDVWRIHSRLGQADFRHMNKLIRVLIQMPVEPLHDAEQQVRVFILTGRSAGHTHLPQIVRPQPHTPSQIVMRQQQRVVPRGLAIWVRPHPTVRRIFVAIRQRRIPHTPIHPWQEGIRRLREADIPGVRQRRVAADMHYGNLLTRRRDARHIGVQPQVIRVCRRASCRGNLVVLDVVLCLDIGAKHTQRLEHLRVLVKQLLLPRIPQRKPLGNTGGLLFIPFLRKQRPNELGQQDGFQPQRKSLCPEVHQLPRHQRQCHVQRADPGLPYRSDIGQRPYGDRQL